MIKRLFLFSLIPLCFSCVSNRKFQDEQSAKNTAITQAQKAQEELLSETERRKKTEMELSGVRSDFNDLNDDHQLLTTRYHQQQRLNKDLQDSYDKLLALNEKLRGDANDRRKLLSEELSQKESELQRKEMELQRKQTELDDLSARLKLEREEIDKLRKELEQRNKDVEALQKDLLDREKRVKELEDAIAARDALSKALKDKLNQALLGFNSSDLSVEERNGKVYVSLSQDLLFASGSSTIDSKGLDAIKKLADVLIKNQDISILVEGHTDSDGDATMNWKLSTDRSLSIVYALINNKVKPNRITAAGRGEHVPVASNDSDSGKAKNRRTDIILSPDLDEIFKLISK